MKIDQSQVDELVTRPSEGLNVEVKTWIDPNAPEGAAKIVRAALALRNRNGGYLVVGFKDKTLEPDVEREPRDVRAAFHFDKIQGLVSRHASDLFEIGVAFGMRDGKEYPVIKIPDGVLWPVAAKADLMDGDNTKKLIRYGEVYFRTLSANGTPSTAPARPEDWREIMDICFENREKDFGRLLRRYVGSREATTVMELLGQEGIASAARPFRQRAIKLLDEGEVRFREALSARQLTPEEKAIAQGASFSIAMVVDPPHADALPDRVFMTTIGSSNPQYTGWPAWLDSSTFSDPSSRPKVKNNAWEALIVSPAAWSKHVDFLRFDPKGEFYQWRNLQDDVSDRIKPQTALDPIIVIIRVAEHIAAGLAIIKALGWNPEKTRLGFAFRWTKLHGRQLTPWANPWVTISSFDVAHDDNVTTFVEVPLETSPTAIAPAVERAVRELFILFGGYQLPSNAIEQWVRKLVERQLGA
jgi:hypothetical protein